MNFNDDICNIFSVFGITTMRYFIKCLLRERGKRVCVISGLVFSMVNTYFYPLEYLEIRKIRIIKSAEITYVWVVWELFSPRKIVVYNISQDYQYYSFVIKLSFHLYLISYKKYILRYTNFIYQFEIKRNCIYIVNNLTECWRVYIQLVGQNRKFNHNKMQNVPMKLLWKYHCVFLLKNVFSKRFHVYNKLLLNKK